MHKRLSLRLSVSSLLLTAGALLGAAAHAADHPARAHDNMLVDGHGMTLYTFDHDTSGKSACNGGCASNWPPLAAAAGAAKQGDYSVVKRDDGSLQWAYKGKPLYRFKADTKPGDAKGDKVKNVWHTARP